MGAKNATNLAMILGGHVRGDMSRIWSEITIFVIDLSFDSMYYRNYRTTPWMVSRGERLIVEAIVGSVHFGEPDNFVKE